MTSVEYADFRTGFRGLPDRLRGLLEVYSVRDMCDVGGGANPALSPEEIGEYGLNYTLLDISPAELAMAPDVGLTKVCADIADPDMIADLHSQFDLVFSNTLAEHVRRPMQFHANVYDMLRRGGIAAHFMPTMFDPMFVANRILPESASRPLVRRAQPKRNLDTNKGKFPAYYRWCRGPSDRHLNRFRRLGYEVDVAVGYFGTAYLRGTPRLDKKYETVNGYLVRHPVDALCSYTWLVLRKP